MSEVNFDKNREREPYTFANINLLGVCNAKCFFCLGRDISQLLQKHNQTNIHYANWQNFGRFMDKCREEGIKNIYLTGQNVDSLQYSYFTELSKFLQGQGFTFGIRTNGLLAKQMNEEVLAINGTVGYSIHTLNPVRLVRSWGGLNYLTTIGC